MSTGPERNLLIFKLGLITSSCAGKESVLLSRERQKSSPFEQNHIYVDNVQHRECAANMNKPNCFKSVETVCSA